MAKLLYRTGHIGNYGVGKPPLGEPLRSPHVRYQRAPLLRYLPGRVNRYGAIHYQFSTFSLNGEEASDKNRG